MDFDQAFVKTHSIDLKWIIVLLSDALHSTVSMDQPSFTVIEYKENRNISLNFVYHPIKLVKYYPFLFVLNHLKLDF